MKLVQMNLRAYGPFTNKIIDFGEGTNNPGLHIVLGANEAGKSTALRALRAVLFGMNDMRDAHLHPKDMLRVALKVKTAEGEMLHVERRKGKGAKSLLFSGSDKAVPVEEWARVLPVEDAELFEQMFGLNYERLLEGGRQLAGFKSDIGKALLAAAGDLGQTVARMRDMQDRADAIFSPRATSSKLRQAFSAYQVADKAFRDERYTSREYKVAVARRDEIDEELKRIGLDRLRYAEELNRLTRMQTAAPHVHRLLEDEKALEGYAGCVLLPEGFEQRFSAAMGSLRAEEGRRDDAAAELDRLTQELAAIPRDRVLAGLVAEIDKWKDLSGKILAARSDCPKREADYKRLELNREACCVQLGVTADALPRLLVEQRKRIELLSGKQLVLEANRNVLPGKIAAMELSLREAEHSLTVLPMETDTAELAERLVQVRSRKHAEAEGKQLRIERDQFAGRLSNDLKGLPFWTGTADQLEMLRAPLPASVSEFAERFVKHQARKDQLTGEKLKITQEVERRSVELNQLEVQQSIPTESELTASRARRDNGWTAVKERWLKGLTGGAAESAFLETAEQALPDAYEVAVVNADSVADRLRLEADRVEQKRTVMEAAATARLRSVDIDKTLVNHAEDFQRLEMEWSGLWAETGITPRSPREMQAWLESRGTLVGQLRDLKRLSGQVDELEVEVEGWRKLLSIALGETTERPLADLLSRAEVKVREFTELRKHRADAVNKILQLKQNLEVAKDEQRRNDSEVEKWRSSWIAAVAGLPVSGTADPEAVKEVIRLMDESLSATEEMTALRHRIDAMKKDEDEFVEAVHNIATRAGRQDLTAGDALLAISVLQEMARVALSNETKAVGIIANQAREQKKLSDTRTAVAKYQVTIEELRTDAKVEHANLLPEAIRANLKRCELTETISGHRSALTNSCGNLALDEFIAQVQTANLDLIPAELERLREEIGCLEDAKAKYISERDAIDKEFQLRETAAALNNAAGEKFSVAARIDALTGEYLEQQIGARLLAKAMALYREKNQDPLLKRAGEYFSTLTCGAFVSLAIDDVGNQKILKGVRRLTGELLDVEAMSDGTRDQLFLALRLAFIETHCDQTTACPVILDDVLMAFDDVRTGAALQALHELSRKTQVLIFTHHEHHVSLANKLLGPEGYCLHQLVVPMNATA